MATKIYAQIATIARITEVLDADTASTMLGDEHAIATSFCQQAAARADRALAQIGDNGDHSADATSARLLARGSYDPPPRSLGDRACSEQWFTPTPPPAHIARNRPLHRSARVADRSPGGAGS